MLDVEDPATYPGRYHRAGEPGTWYASLTERAAWAELFRHWETAEISPLEVRRRVGRVQVTDLAVLDLTDGALRAALGVAAEDLVGDEWSVCQEIGTAARASGFGGLLAPSGALGYFPRKRGKKRLHGFGAASGRTVRR